METARTSPANNDVAAQVLVRFRGEEVVELHFTEPLTEVYQGNATLHTHDYRVAPAKDITQPDTAVAYQLFWQLNGVIGRETATAEYRKANLTFGQVYLASQELREQLKAQLEIAIKQFTGQQTLILWY